MSVSHPQSAGNGVDLAEEIAGVEKECMLILESLLLGFNLPPIIDRTDHPRRHETDDVTAVIVSVEGDAWGLFLEGNRQCPGGVLYAFNPFWLSRQPSPSDVTMETLYIHKAVTADRGGQTYLDVFQPPRRVTYLTNHVIDSDQFPPLVEAGLKISSFGLDLPCSNSLPISLRANDKLLTHTLCAEAGVPHPVTLGFWLPGEGSPVYPDYFPSVRVVRLSSKDVPLENIEKSVRDFLESEPMKRHDKVAVKAYGLLWFSSKGVSFHATSEVKAIVKAVLDLISQIVPGEGVLVQSFHTTFDRRLVQGVDVSAANIEEEQLQCRIRVIVCRTLSDSARVTSVTCNLSDVNSPVNGDNAVATSLELKLRKWGCDVMQQKQIGDVLKKTSEKVLLKLIEQEQRLSPRERGGVEARLEMIGLDVLLTTLDDVITPVVIEVNGQGCIEQAMGYQWMHPALQGECEYLWAQVMVARSQRHLMKNKTVLVIGGGQELQRRLLTDCLDLGIKIVLLDSNPNHKAKNHVHHFLHTDINDHTHDQEHADVIVERVLSAVGHVDGCVTFRNDCAALTSLVGTGLGLAHTQDYKAVCNALSKVVTCDNLLADGRWKAHMMLPNIYVIPAVRVTGTTRDIEEAVRKVPLPAILTNDFGTGSAGEHHVTSVTELEEYTKQTSMDGQAVTRPLVLRPLVKGTRHDLQLVFYEEYLTAAFVVDIGKTEQPDYRQTLAVVPSVLSDESQRQLIAAALSCCKSLGLTTGVVSVKMVLATQGPKLLEISACMGDLYTRDFIRTIYDVDLLHLSLMATCGVRPVASNSLLGGFSTSFTRHNNGQLIGLLLYQDRHGNALKTTATPERLQSLHDKGAITLVQFQEMPDDLKQENKNPVAILGVHGATLEEAREKFKATFLVLGLETEDSLAELLQNVDDSGY